MTYGVTDNKSVFYKGTLVECLAAKERMEQRLVGQTFNVVLYSRGDKHDTME